MPTRRRKRKMKFRCLRGMNYPDPQHPGREKRVEPGDIVEDVPEESVEWYKKKGCIVEVAEDPPVAEGKSAKKKFKTEGGG